MKKYLAILSIIASANTFAGSIDYLAQQDAEYFAHPSMIGKVGVSGAFYNPAGTVFLEDGLYVQLNSQTLFKNYEMETRLPGTDKLSHESDHPSAFVPSMQIVKKEGDRAYFLHTGAAAGGGTVKYGNGISAFEVIGQGIQAGLRKKAGGQLFPNAEVDYLGGSTVNGSSYYINTTFGMAQKVNSKFSVAGGVRVIYAMRELDGTAHFELDTKNPKLFEKLGGKGKEKGNIDVNIDSERTGWGVGGVIGFNYQPTEKLNIGFKYESEIELNLKADGDIKVTSSYPVFKISTKDGSILENIDGSLRKEPVISEWLENDRRNLPAVMALGVSYELTNRITLLSSGNYYFIKDANRNGVYDNYDNGYEVSIGVDYKLNDKWTLMAGYQYTDTGANEKTYKDTDYALDADMYGVGVKYTPDETKEFVVAYSYVDYKNGTATRDGHETTTFKKQVDAIALSATFKF
ncbi:outer membrane protein transport protein [Fusobacterium sp.]|uniref:OmpP1/FadL family transporter n=1 Tax=Fusobacterium sp. TaxID=68766 RepID=UPI00262448A6|nr:outer membrane protein transport protein [Fusobacterium sp.]